MAFTPLNALSAFVAVARRLSFAAAAKDLGVSTSALSQSVRQLEERLGATLLARTSRRVALTDAGQRLLDNAGPAVDQALESLKTVKAKRGQVTGRIRLTAPSASVPLVFARLLPRFIERHPNVEVELIGHSCKDHEEASIAVRSPRLMEFVEFYRKRVAERMRDAAETDDAESAKEDDPE